MSSMYEDIGGAPVSCEDMKNKLLLVRNRNLAALQHAWQHKERVYEQKVGELTSALRESEEKLIAYECAFEKIENGVVPVSMGRLEYLRLLFVRDTVRTVQSEVQRRCDELWTRLKKRLGSDGSTTFDILDKEGMAEMLKDVELAKLRVEVRRTRARLDTAELDTQVWMERHSKAVVRLEELRKELSTRPAGLLGGSDCEKAAEEMGRLNERIAQLQFAIEHPTNAVVYSSPQYKTLDQHNERLREANAKLVAALNSLRLLIDEQKTKYDKMLASYQEADSAAMDELNGRLAELDEMCLKAHYEKEYWKRIAVDFKKWPVWISISDQLQKLLQNFDEHRRLADRELRQKRATVSKLTNDLEKLQGDVVTLAKLRLTPEDGESDNDEPDNKRPRLTEPAETTTTMTTTAGSPGAEALLEEGEVDERAEKVIQGLRWNEHVYRNRIFALEHVGRMLRRDLAEAFEHEQENCDDIDAIEKSNDRLYTRYCELVNNLGCIEQSRLHLAAEVDRRESAISQGL